MGSGDHHGTSYVVVQTAGISTEEAYWCTPWIGHCLHGYANHLLDNCSQSLQPHFDGLFASLIFPKAFSETRNAAGCGKHYAGQNVQPASADNECLANRHTTAARVEPFSMHCITATGTGHRDNKICGARSQ